MVFFCSAIWLFSVAGASATPQDQQELLTQRVNEYWGLKIKRDFEKSYLYESPEYRKNVPLSKYLTSIGPGIEWLSVKVEKVLVEKDLATVHVKIAYRWSMVPVKSKEGFTGTTSEEWRMVDGIWYHDKKQSDIASKLEKLKLKQIK